MKQIENTKQRAIKMGRGHQSLNTKKIYTAHQSQ